MNEYQDFQSAYEITLDRLRAKGSRVGGVMSPNTVGSDFGTKDRPFIELQAEGFRLLNPRRRWLTGSPRQPSAVFAVANFIFTLGGGQDYEMIQSYNARGKSFLEDESRYESSFGIRLFSPGHQIAYVMKKLKDDKNSRRATASIYVPEDTVLDRRDTPCAIALQFLIRNGKLDCVCFMRSQSAAMVLPYDIFLFTMIQEWVATTLGTEVGTYSHIAASLHFYENEGELVANVIGGEGEAPEMKQMSIANPSIANSLVAAERAIRYLPTASNVQQALSGIDPYWVDILSPIVDFHLSQPRSSYFFDARPQ